MMSFRNRSLFVSAGLMWALNLGATSANAHEHDPSHGDAHSHDHAESEGASSAPASQPASMPASQPANDRHHGHHKHRDGQHHEHNSGHHKHHGAHHSGHHKHHGSHQLQAALAVCQRENPALGQGPIGTTFQAGAFGAARRLCPKTEVGFFLRAPVTAEIGAELLADFVGEVPEFVSGVFAGGETFYVNAAAGSGVALSWAPFRRVELFLEIEALRAQYVRGSVTSTAVGFGHLSPGATIVLSEGTAHAIGVTARAQLPTATGFYKNVFPFALDAGVSGLVQPFGFLRLHGYLGGSGAIAVGPVADARAGLVGVAGFEVIPFDWLSFVADLNARGLYDAPLDHLAVAVGVRAAILSTVGIEVAAIAPLAGEERALTALMTRATWRFGDLSVSRLLEGDVMWNEAVFYERPSDCQCER